MTAEPRSAGVHAGALGVSVTVPDGEPVPTALIAETRKSYAVAFVRPVTVAPVVALTPSENVVQVPAPAGDFSTR